MATQRVDGTTTTLRSCSQKNKKKHTNKTEHTLPMAAIFHGQGATAPLSWAFARRTASTTLGGALATSSLEEQADLLLGVPFG